ncbi:group I intron-associated PD-(D/E)XK endonuclease [Halobacterium sp. CBA1126]|uniref:group I intron-associated PD-(D/E)XK endonuclease n=1 Tax=Halobacterium TaxID=2239 RepID=UPI0018D22857|nr:group I intron-associated PD-(D/E)XK endonuclease [Halobacterium sp. CBA1126]
MESHRKGDLTEATVITELKRREIPVSVPFGDNERYDLVAESAGDLYRLQVKTGWLSDGCVEFHGKSSHTNSSGNVYKTYDGDTDYFAVYCHELEQLYLVPETAFETEMRLRVEDPEIEQPSINWAADYEFDEQWPPEDTTSGPANDREAIIETLRDRGVDAIDAIDSDAPYEAVLRTPDDDLLRAAVRRGSVTNGRIRFDTSGTVPGPEAVDYAVVDCAERGEQYLVERASYERTTSLRVTEPEQAQPSIKWAEEYEFGACWPPG